MNMLTLVSNKSFKEIIIKQNKYPLRWFLMYHSKQNKNKRNKNVSYSNQKDFLHKKILFFHKKTNISESHTLKIIHNVVQS